MIDMKIRDFFVLGIVAYLLYLALRYIKRHKELHLGCSNCSNCRSDFCDRKKHIS